MLHTEDDEMILDQVSTRMCQQQPKQQQQQRKITPNTKREQVFMPMTKHQKRVYLFCSHS